MTLRLAPLLRVRAGEDCAPCEVAAKRLRERDLPVSVRIGLRLVQEDPPALAQLDVDAAVCDRRAGLCQEGALERHPLAIADGAGAERRGYRQLRRVLRYPRSDERREVRGEHVRLDGAESGGGVIAGDGLVDAR